MVSDQEPRYRFRDSNGNITGTVFERGGELVVQEGTSGNENELVLQSDGTVQAKRLAGGYLYAGAFPGSDPDARLDNALAAANSGDAIYLEAADYTADRTITTGVGLIGQIQRPNGARFRGATVDCNVPTRLSHIRLDQATVVNLNSVQSMITMCGGDNSDINVNAGDCLIFGFRDIDVTFDSSTADGFADGGFAGSVVVDNGSNIVGDIT